MIDDFIQYYSKIEFILKGINITLQYSILSLILGLILGSLLAFLKTGKSKFLKKIAEFYTSVFRGTPLLIQLTIIYFALPNLLNIKLSIFASGVIAFSLNSAAYLSEIIRTGINSIDIGQFEAAKTLNIPRFLMMKDIILPQAFKNIFPMLTNELINLIKESAIISTIGGLDLMRRAQIIALETYTYFTPMIIAACCYYIMVLIINNISIFLEKKISIKK